MSIELLIIATPVLLLGFLLLPHLPVLGILGVLLVARTAVDGPFNAAVGSLPLSAVVGVVILALAIASAFRGWRGFAGFAVFAGAVYLSAQAALTFDPEAMSEYVRLMSVAGVFVIIANLRRPPAASSVVAVVQIVALTSASLSIMQFASGTGLIVDGVLRATGTMAHPNSAALLYAMGILASLVSYVELGRKRRHVWVTLVLFVALLSTGGVAGVVTVTSMLVAYAFLSPRVTIKGRLGLFLAGCFGATAFIISPLGRERLSEFSSLDLSGQSGERNSLEWRFGRWNDVLRYWNESPLVGVGYGASTRGALLNGYPPHNEYVRILVETGVLGSAVALVLIIIVVLRLRLNIKDPSSSIKLLGTLSLAMLIGMLVNAITENTFMYSIPGYLLALLIGSANRFSRQPQASRTPTTRAIERQAHV